ncbi:hypothetical protein [Paenibacillus terrae]|uniref:RCK N-terminal domain-containing protein n=1 Tax=Paenibacillus terrae TaxID=159743 RepID=A0A0D7X3W1_9BACL|nr:hypothetical protein [Paenibacillus terrae]KJD45914.1 hypothetical protein QD47_08875 [Paenibacillus terrae]
MSRHAALLVFAPNLAGEQFLQALSEGGELFVALACNPDQQQHLYELGVENVIEFNIKEKHLKQLPTKEFSKVYIFEEQLGQCYQVLEVIRQWTCGTIYVITKNHYPQMIYKALGADFVIRTASDDLSFLLDKCKHTEGGL